MLVAWGLFPDSSASTCFVACARVCLSLSFILLGAHGGMLSVSFVPSRRFEWGPNCCTKFCTEVSLLSRYGASSQERRGHEDVRCLLACSKEVPSISKAATIDQGENMIDLSFRSTSKFVINDDDKQNPKLPGAFVMLRLILTMVGRKLSRNPNTYSSVLGLLWSLISFQWGIDMPSLVSNSIKIISDAGLGMAMFSLGLFMALQPRIIACGTKMAILSMLIRFIAGPMIMSMTSMAVGLKGARLRTAIVQAALPQGIVPFVFAREYGLHPDILSTGVIFGMLVSLPMTLLYYILLGL